MFKKIIALLLVVVFVSYAKHHARGKINLSSQDIYKKARAAINIKRAIALLKKDKLKYERMNFDENEDFRKWYINKMDACINYYQKKWNGKSSLFPFRAFDRVAISYLHFPFISLNLDKAQVVRLLAFLNDSSSFWWGQVCTPSNKYKIIFYRAGRQVARAVVGDDFSDIYCYAFRKHILSKYGAIKRDREKVLRKFFHGFL